MKDSPSRLSNRRPLKYPGIRQWWDAGGKTQTTPEFAQLIESIDISEHRAFNWNKEEGFVPWKHFRLP
jgi:hypothetical protein